MQNQNKFSYKAKAFLFFAGPACFVFSAVVIIPFLYGIYLTFTGWDGILDAKPFVGLTNYRAVFQDMEFWKSLWRTIRYVLFTVILSNLAAFCLAYLVTSKIRGQNFFRVGFFTPNLIGGIVLGYIWKFVFSRAIPVVGEATGIGIFSSSWLSDSTKAFWSLVVVTVWQLSGYLMLIYIAGLTGVPKDIIEAGKIDGCKEGQAIRYITLPMMAASFTICVFLSITRSFMIYDVNISLTEGGPYNSTVMVAMHVYQKAFSSKEYGIGQAEALILFLIIAVIAVSQAYFGKSKEVDA